jgi:hypothetical protein
MSCVDEVCDAICPCHLVSLNFQACDIVVILKQKKGEDYGLDCVCGEFDIRTKSHVLASVLLVKNRLKIGEDTRRNGKTSYCRVRRVTKSVYKMCFHTLEREDEADENPV